MTENAPAFSLWGLLCSLARLWRVHLALMALALFWPRALDE